MLLSLFLHWNDLKYTLILKQSYTRADLQDKLLEIRAQNDATMILVTHDVDEAIYLSDRIVIMTPRPGKISEVLEVNLPHPRDRGCTKFINLRREILERFHLASANPQAEYSHCIDCTSPCPLQ